MLQNLYINPQNSAKSADGSHLTNVTDEEMQEHYDNFFEDCFVEAEEKYGEIEEMNVCDNLGDHLVSLHKPQICCAMPIRNMIVCWLPTAQLSIMSFFFMFFFK